MLLELLTDEIAATRERLWNFLHSVGINGKISSIISLSDVLVYKKMRIVWGGKSFERTKQA